MPGRCKASAAQVALPYQLHATGVEGPDRPRHQREPDEVGHRPQLEVILPRCNRLIDVTHDKKPRGGEGGWGQEGSFEGIVEQSNLILWATSNNRERARHGL